MAANWFFALATALVLIMLLIRLPKEEQKLIEHIGAEDRQYMVHTGRLLARTQCKTALPSAPVSHILENYYAARTDQNTV